jgi:hypothetical protein
VGGKPLAEYCGRLLRDYAGAHPRNRGSRPRLQATGPKL